MNFPAVVSGGVPGVPEAVRGGATTADRRVMPGTVIARGARPRELSAQVGRGRSVGAVGVGAEGAVGRTGAGGLGTADELEPAASTLRGSDASSSPVHQIPATPTSTASTTTAPTTARLIGRPRLRPRVLCVLPRSARG